MDSKKPQQSEERSDNRNKVTIPSSLTLRIENPSIKITRSRSLYDDDEIHGTNTVHIVAPYGNYEDESKKSVSILKANRPPSILKSRKYSSNSAEKIKCDNWSNYADRYKSYYSIPVRDSEVSEDMCFKAKVKFFFSIAGSAVLISMGLLDPGNIAGDIEVARMIGFLSVWVQLLSHVILYYYQEAAIMIAFHSKYSIASLGKICLTRKTKNALWVQIELALIVSDTQEILGGAVALKILVGLSLEKSVLQTVGISSLILFIQDINQRMFEGVFQMFLICMCMTFEADYQMSSTTVMDLFRWPQHKIDSFTSAQIGNSLTSLIGAMIMPHNLYLQSNLVLTRDIRKTSPHKSDIILKFLKIETQIILIVSFFVNTTIIGSFCDFPIRDDLDLMHAGLLIKTRLGEIALTTYAIGLFVSGLSSSSSGALAGQLIMQDFMNLSSVHNNIRILMTRFVAIFPCLFFVKFAQIKTVNLFLNVFQAVQLPFVVIPMIKYMSNSTIMGPKFSNAPNNAAKKKIGVLVTMTIIIISFNLLSVFFVVSEIQKQFSIENAKANFVFFGMLIIIIIVYSGSQVVISFDPIDTTEQLNRRLCEGLNTTEYLDNDPASFKKFNNGAEQFKEQYSPLLISAEQKQKIHISDKIKSFEDLYKDSKSLFMIEENIDSQGTSIMSPGIMPNPSYTLSTHPNLFLMKKNMSDPIYSIMSKEPTTVIRIEGVNLPQSEYCFPNFNDNTVKAIQPKKRSESSNSEDDDTKTKEKTKKK